MRFFAANYAIRSAAFLGGSITAVTTTGYVDQVKPLIRTTAPFYSLGTFTNLGKGATSSWYALARVANIVQPLAPDVVCIDYAVNDTDADFFACSGEALIRRLITLLPTTRLVFIAFTRIADIGVNDPTNTQDTLKERWRTICNHYGVNFADWADELVRLVGAGANVTDYLTDEVHPNADGHISAAGILLQPINSAMGSTSPGALPDRLYDCADFEATPTWRNGTDNDGETGTGWSDDGTARQSSTANDTITWNFTGVSWGFKFTPTGAGEVGVTVDGGDETIYDMGGSGECVAPATVLDNTAHAVVFRVESGLVRIENFISI